MVDRNLDTDFERRLQDLFDATPDLADSEQFVALIEGELERRRRLLFWSAGLAVAALGVATYFAVDPLWGQWANQAFGWANRILARASQAGAAAPYASLAAPIGMMLVAGVAAMIGLRGGRRI